MSAAGPAVDILLSTYQGARFLEQQLDSLARQTRADWRLLVRDDGSTDTTRELLAAWARREPRLELITDARGRLGARRSFFALLGHSRAPAFAFCDQDDRWAPTKLGEQLAALAHLPSVTPAAVCSDAELVDQTLVPVARSFARFQGHAPAQRLVWPRLLAQNVVVGCTLVGNAALRKRICASLVEAEAAAVMHDWWAALIASAFGGITYLDRPLVRYRQHGDNVLGAKGSGLRRYLNNLRRGETPLKAVRYLRAISAQAAALDRAVGADLAEARRRPLRLLASAAGRRVSWPGLIGAWRAGVRMTSPDQDLVLLLAAAVLDPLLRAQPLLAGQDTAARKG